MAKKIIIADVQKEYIERLRGYIQKKYTDRYDIEVFYEKKELLQYITIHKCDILLLTPQMYDEILNLKNIKLAVILQEDNEAIPNVEKFKWIIQKYTRISIMVNYIEEQFEEVERNRPLVYSVYSPSGGVGQTTIALGVALSYMKQDKKVLYVNLEETDSTGMFLEREGDIPENILLKIGQVQDIQFLAEAIKQDSGTKLMYLKRDIIEAHLGLYRSIGYIIEKVIEYDIANIVVLDLGHQYNTLQVELMEESDYILLVDDTRSHSRFKISQILRTTQGEFLLSEKVRRVINQGKEIVNDLPIQVVGKVEKVYSSAPIGVCETIAKGKLIKLHGLV